MENKTIILRSPAGNKYKLSFVLFQPMTEINVSIFEVSLERILLIEKENPAKIFQFVTKQIEHFLQENEVILFYFCDNSDIYYRNDKKRRFTSPQHFRSELFNKLFERRKAEGLLLSSSMVKSRVSTHYISFIYKEIYASYAETLLAEIQAYQK